jgi:hypothetical protein
VSAARVSGREVSREEATTDIAARPTRVVDEHGPEAFVVSTSNWNTSVEMGMGRAAGS